MLIERAVGPTAGTVMYQQARRIGELNARGGPSYRNLATVQCQSYLAAANALSLVSREHAWVAIVADENVERVSFAIWLFT